MKRNSVKQFLKKHFTANPLSYLGWLGIIGIFGILFVPVFIPFLLCFTFFSYHNMMADELFWKNVHRASVRGFWSVFVLDVVIAVVLFIRGMTYGIRHGEIPITIEKNVISMGIFSYNQFMISFLTFFASITLMILIFTVSMMRFKKMEKKMVEE